MKFLGKIILFIIVNAIAILVAAHYVSGFVFQGNLTDLAIAAAILTLFNTFIRPLLKLVFAPFINLTFGLLAIAMNAGIIYTLDKFSPSLNINGLSPLIIATLIISFINILVNLSTKLGD